MSVLIKGVKTPNTCEECNLESFCDKWIEARKMCGEWKLGAKATIRHPDCPLVQIPEPHGRLGDLDAVAKRLGITDMNCNKCAWGNHGFCGRGGDFEDACVAIEEAPTIIPAEEGKT